MSNSEIQQRMETEMGDARRMGNTELVDHLKATILRMLENDED